LRPVLFSTMQVESGAVYHAVAPGGDVRSPVYHARNVAHSFTTTFNARGVSLQPTDVSDAEALALRLTAYGPASAPAPVAMSAWRATGGRVERASLQPDRPLIEWYLNGRLGLEQGFTVAAPPPGDAGTLAVDLTVGEGWTAAEAEPGTVMLTAEGAAPLTYGHLTAIDAAGAVLPTRLVVTSRRIRLEVTTAGARYPFLIDPVIQRAKLGAMGPAAGDQLGYSVAVSGDTAIVGAIQQDERGTDSGAAYVFVRNGTSWSQQAKLTAIDAAAGDKFGFSVAMSGNRAVVGAYLKQGATGAAYVFVRSGTSWTQQAKLTATDAAAADNFGYSVAIDGGTVAVGAWGDDESPFTNSGAAYVFEENGAAWPQFQKLTVSGPSAFFGTGVAVSGQTVLVGAQGRVGPGLSLSQGSASVFVRGPSSWTWQAELTASDGAAADIFGASVALAGNTAVVGAPQDDRITGSDLGAAYVYTRSGTSWTQEQKLTASDGASGDRLGFRVAIGGDTVVAGAAADDGGAGDDQGSAYVFVRSGTTWSPQAKLTPDDATAGDQFGWSVAVSFAGAVGTAVVGARLDDDGGPDGGSLYLYTGSGANWSQAKPAVNADVPFSFFGYSVAISADTAVVGAYLDNGGGGAAEGAAFVFVRSGTGWTWRATLRADDAAADKGFGYSVAVAGDTVVVGSLFDDGLGGIDQGSAYVFVRNGTSWSQQAKLVANDAAARDYFGHDVAMDGDTVVVGAPQDDGGVGADQGSAYVFVRNGTSWSPQGRLMAIDAAASDRFGSSVAVAGDRVVVGAPFDNGLGGIDQGSAYVFVRTGTSWSQQEKLTASDAAAGDRFGHSVAVAGQTAVVGALFDDGLGGPDQGSAYVFVWNGTSWSQQEKLTAIDAAVGDNFGNDVALAGDQAVVGSSRDNGDQGSAYVFVRNGSNWRQQDKLASNDAADHIFGVSVAVAGQTIVVGAQTANFVGVAYVLSVTRAFTDDPLAAGVTVVRASHFQEMRDRVNALRTARMLAPFTFTNPVLSATVSIQAAHLTEIRVALDQVYTADAVAKPVYTTPAIGAGTRFAPWTSPSSGWRSRIENDEGVLTHATLVSHPARTRTRRRLPAPLETRRGGWR
jgi:hypothetical protein